jgi:hypothetical protein
MFLLLRTPIELTKSIAPRKIIDQIDNKENYKLLHSIGNL